MDDLPARFAIPVLGVSKAGRDILSGALLVINSSKKATGQELRIKGLLNSLGFHESSAFAYAIEHPPQQSESKSIGATAGPVAIGAYATGIGLWSGGTMLENATVGQAIDKPITDLLPALDPTGNAVLDFVAAVGLGAIATYAHFKSKDARQTFRLQNAINKYKHHWNEAVGQQNELIDQVIEYSSNVGDQKLDFDSASIITPRLIDAVYRNRPEVERILRVNLERDSFALGD